MSSRLDQVFGAAPPKFNATFNAPDEVVRTLDPTSPGLLPPRDVDLADLENWLQQHRNTSADEHGCMNHQNDPHRRLMADVRTLLACHRAGGEVNPATGMTEPVTSFLRSLPMFGDTVAHLDFGTALLRVRQALDSVLLNTTDTIGAPALVCFALHRLLGFVSLALLCFGSFALHFPLIL